MPAFKCKSCCNSDICSQLWGLSNILYGDPGTFYILYIFAVTLKLLIASISLI